MTKMSLHGIVPLLVALSACAAASEREDVASGSASASDGATTTFHPTRFQDVQVALGGKIPFPPQKLVEGLLALEPASKVTAAIIPYGRSLERTATDFRAPRSMFLWQDDASRAPFRLFVGYTPNAEQLEVISWNWQRRQYDFLVVTDYVEGKTPRVVRPPRGVCTSCHQASTPMFAAVPWAESTFNATIKDKVAAESQDPFSQWLLSLPPPAGASRVGIQTALLDARIQSSTRFYQQQKICANACGGDLECRKGVLFAALLENIEPGKASSLSAAWKDRMSTAMRSAWPADDFAVNDSIIVDRTVDLSSPLSFTRAEDPLTWQTPSLGRGVSSGTGELLPMYAQCWSFTSDQMQTLKGWGADKVEAALASEQLTTLVATWLPSETTIVSTLADAVSAPLPVVSPATIPWPPSHPATPQEPPKPKKTTVELFNEYCVLCHSGPSPRPQILPLSDLPALGRYVGSAGRTVRSLMDPTHLVMPPADSDRPTTDELQQMLADLPQ